MTYDLITEQVLGSAGATFTIGSIPGTYRDLVLEVVCTLSAAGSNYLMINGDSGTNYSELLVWGDGATVGAWNTNPSTQVTLNGRNSIPTIGSPIILQINLPSYANTGVCKSVLAQSFAVTAENDVSVTVWASTAAITSLTLMNSSGAQYSIGSTFRLWGIK